ncbi:uroporphyrinogen-III synthase [Rhodopseudomonas thermotolerans]|jgi:uroporphyrinogen-III synthase|uniref:Uroporphyrinogen-III synthase n=2 Tax=Rhodopseudomonas TaxID=1073 RepID=A0A336JK04_9BRAD|nr:MULTISPECIES: uroporphyrinogen-III synthase [Rhodopseudomonas]RED38012.1 uroporphyrinogen-III synthase [Rhodopseudomonas pentothenatexigens]REG05205.1 uroporphyrinogen-III synthase [Rhodopseudomonas thermotolerans]SSW90037.1 uroporphyrinogen-III synthase [Rhodopseudomonas pentothenatexigens]
MAGRLQGTRILILETREEAQFARFLRDQGADVLQCPMFEIRDAPDLAPVSAWIDRLIAAPFDDLVLLTGEGLRRLTKLARATGREQPFVAAVGRTRTLIRGPKPGRALREIGLEPSMTAEAPTSDGVAATLKNCDLTRRRVGLQLYPERDHAALIDAITSQGAAVDTVLPYVYDAGAAEQTVINAIDQMAGGRVDALALTSSGQVRRLFDVARAHRCDQRLRDGLSNTPIASVGPVVTEELAAHGFSPTITPPNGAFFMKPLISAMISAFDDRRKAPAGSGGSK